MTDRSADQAWSANVRTLASEHFFDLSERLNGTETQSLGLDQRWFASVGVFDVGAGFGEEAWVDHVPVTLLALRLSGARVVCRHGAAQGRSSRSHDVTLQPRGVPNHYTADGAVRFAQIYFDDDFIDRVADGLKPGAHASGRLRDDVIFHPDPTLAAMVEGYVRAALSAETKLELESRAVLMTAQLLRAHHGFAAPAAGDARGGLSPWQLRRACDAMDAHLGEDISLQKLAEVAGCSPPHFSRAFKQSTGQAPFHWLAERRIERAKAMLRESRLSLAEIALAVGFRAQPQFTTAFGRATGVTPGRWRRERLP